MAEGAPKKESEKKPVDAGKQESDDEKFREKARSLIYYVANFRKRRKAEREGEKIPGGGKKEIVEQNKKAAAKSMGNVRFGANMLGAGIILALAGSVALPFWGIEKILEVNKYFMKGFDFFK